jgi:tetratricopeptide (TPR) repeat protein
VAADPKNKQVLTRAGDCFFRMGDMDKTEELFERTLALGYDASALIGLSRVYRQQRSYDRAMQNYQLILDHNPDDTRTMALMGETIFEAHGKTAALEFLIRKKEEHPHAKEIEGALQRISESRAYVLQHN